MVKPRLLFLSPVIPDVARNGMSMRAGAVLRALGERYDVWLHVRAVHGALDAMLPAELHSLCREAVIERGDAGAASPLRLAAVQTRTAAPLAFDGVAFDVIHGFRLSTFAHALAYARAGGEMAAASAHGGQGRARPSGPLLHMDLDETESLTRRRLAALHRRSGDATAARFRELEAELCEAAEREVLRRCDRVYVCSPSERDALAALATERGAAIRVAPNTVPEREPLSPREARETFTFLFVGTLGFAANEDAVSWFCGEVLPELRRLAARDVALAVVGRGATEAVRALGALPGVRVVGEVEDVAPWYAEADAVVVPIRAGGGTRIKALEAMAFGRPVVGTTEGLDGLGMADGEHALVADTAPAFAAQCARLVRDPELGMRLVRNARALLARSFAPAALAEALEPDA